MNYPTWKLDSGFFRKSFRFCPELSGKRPLKRRKQTGKKAEHFRKKADLLSGQIRTTVGQPFHLLSRYESPCKIIAKNFRDNF